MSPLTTLPRELQYKIISNLTHVAPRMQHRSPLHPEEHANHPLLVLSLVSRHFNALVESQCHHELQSLQARINSGRHLRKRNQTSPAGAINIRGAYIKYARSHCNRCGSAESVSCSVTHDCKPMPVCFQCDWVNWKEMIRRDGETLIAVLDGVALLISRDIGPEFLVLDAVWEYELGVSTPDCVFYSRLEDNLVHQIKEKTEDSIRVAPKLLVETDYRWGGFRDACPSNLLWTGLVRYELEKDVNGITNHIVSNLTVTILELYKELYWDVSFWDGLPDTGC